jgi:hypothetical protein
MIDFSNVSLNFMLSLLQASDFSHLYREEDRAKEALILAPFCFSAFDLYGIVLAHYLLHVDKLGFPTDYVRIKEEGIIPEGVLDIPRSVESGILFTGGIAWERQVLTRNTQVCQLIKGYCLRYGYQALRTVKASANTMLRSTRQRTWRVAEPYRVDFSAKEALEACSKLEGELNQVRESLADIKTLSAYDMDAMKINLRTGLSNYSQAFKTLLDLIVRLRALNEKRKTLVVEDGNYFQYFCRKNRDLFKEREDANEMLREFCLLEDETCSVVSRHLRSIVLERKMPSGRIFGPSSDSSPLSRSFGFITRMDDFERQVFVLVYPNEFLTFNHVGEHGRVETFMEYLDIAGIDEHILLDMPAEILCIASQFVTLSDEPAKPARYMATPPSCYITGSMYLRDSPHYFNATLDKLVNAL